MNESSISSSFFNIVRTIGPKQLGQGLDVHLGHDIEVAAFGDSAHDTTRSGDAVPAPLQSPEKMEQVLNQGMSFISGLLEMATGKKIEPVDGDGRLLRIDTTTGEVTMKFKV